MGWCDRDINGIDSRYIVNVRNPAGGKNQSYMSLDRLVRAGIRGFANVLPITTITTTPIWAGTTLVSIAWDATTQGHLDNGDSITIFDSNGNGQKFYVTADVDVGDTILTLDSTVTAFDILDGYEIAVNTLGVLRRQVFGQTINPNTLFDVTVGLPDFRFMTITDALANKIVRVEVNGVHWYYHNSGSSPPLFTWDIVVGALNQMKFTSPIRATDRVVLHVMDQLLYM